MCFEFQWQLPITFVDHRTADKITAHKTIIYLRLALLYKLTSSGTCLYLFPSSLPHPIDQSSTNIRLLANLPTADFISNNPSEIAQNISTQINVIFECKKVLIALEIRVELFTIYSLSWFAFIL